MPFLRRRRDCFYCGKRSSQKQSGPVRQWQCESCDAINHLDENGLITDPPASETATNNRIYATGPPRPVSPESTSAGAAQPFCSTCIKNQYLYMQALAEYLPDPSDPSYASYEASYSEFKTNLERRYPQVCATCVPHVNHQLRKVTYAANADNVRRLLDKTKRGGTRYSGTKGWRDFAVLLGALAWWASVLGQLAWHALGSRLFAYEETSALSPRLCAMQLVSERAMGKSCFVALAPLVQWLLILGFLSSWWNNRLAQRIHGSGRLVNLNEYLVLQVVFLAARSFSVWALRDPSSSFIPIPQEAAHLFMALFIVICTIRSLTLVKFRKISPVSSKLEPVTATAPASLILETPVKPRALSTVPEGQFPIGALASPASRYSYSSHDDAGYESTATTVTSLFDDDYGSEMEWTPTKIPLSPHQYSQPPAQESHATFGANPFRTTLPAAPEHPAHKARKPPMRTFIRASSENRENFFQSMMNHKRPSSSNEDGPGAGAPGTATAGNEIQMQAGKLQIQQQETGLETLFNSVFSLDDEPREVRSAAFTASTTRPGTEAPWVGVAFWLTALALPCGAATYWMMA